MVSRYNSSQTKKYINYILATFALIIIFPLIIVVSAIQKLFYPNLPVFFVQKRCGKDGKAFNIYKFRTMIKNSDKNQKKYKYLNIANGPVFKIPDDPRYTKLGKVLAKLGIDEIPQLINVLKSEMSLVGPRPLPIIEAKKLSSKYKKRELILPGITSSWVISGGHQMSFDKWMRLDLNYVKQANLKTDAEIILKTILLGLKTAVNKLFG